jgi:hypothetical protein
MLSAVVAKNMVEHPTQRFDVHDRWVLSLSVVTYIGGLSVIQWRAIHRVAPERWCVLALGAVVPVLGRWLPPLVVVTLMTIVLGAMHTVTLRRIKGRQRRIRS